MIYAPADFVAVTVPADDRGGCGEQHRRPDGAHTWALSCEACEPFLMQSDSRWVRTAAEIPETYDQRKSRETLAIRGTQDRDDILTIALARLAGLDLPPSLAGAPSRLAIGTAGRDDGLPGRTPAAGGPGFLRYLRTSDALSRGRRAGCVMTEGSQPGLTLVTAPKFCTSCGQELPEAGGMCPACPQVDAQRRAVMASYFGQMQALRDIDAAEHAAELRVRADVAQA